MGNGFYRDERRQVVDNNPNTKKGTTSGTPLATAPAIGGSSSRGSALQNGGNSAVVPVNQKPARNRAAK